MARTFVMTLALLSLVGCRSRISSGPVFADDDEIFAFDLDTAVRTIAIWKRSESRGLRGVIVLERTPAPAQAIVTPPEWSVVHVGFGPVIEPWRVTDPTQLPAWGGVGAGEITFLGSDQDDQWWNACRLRVAVDVEPAATMDSVERPANLRAVESFQDDELYVAGGVCNP